MVFQSRAFKFAIPLGFSPVSANEACLLHSLRWTCPEISADFQPEAGTSPGTEFIGNCERNGLIETRC